MADFMAVVAQTVGAAVVQEAVSRTVSFVLGKRKEKVSQEQYQERLRMAVHEVEFVLERTAKMPITEISLLRERIELKRDFVQAACLLIISSRHKKRQALLQGQQDQMMQEAMTGCSSPQGFATHPAMFSVSSFIGMTKDELLCLSCENVERFEQFADSARNILTRVESGCSLRHRMYFSSPLVRHLFEWKTLRCRMVQADQERDFVLWPARLDEERGVEVLVRYEYLDHKRPEKSFIVGLVIRVSESTDIAGIAINCLQSLASQFNLVADTAMEELTLLANLQDVSHSQAPPWVGIEEAHKEITQRYHPDPFCCSNAKGHGSCVNNNNGVSSELLSHVFPEEVTVFYFNCYISAPEYSLLSVERNGRPPLELSVYVVPHYDVHDERQQASYAVEEIGDTSVQERIDASMQQVGETVRSRALNCFLRQPKVNKYEIAWVTKHGSVSFCVEKLRTRTLKTRSRSKS